MSQTFKSTDPLPLSEASRDADPALFGTVSRPAKDWLYRRKQAIKNAASALGEFP